MPQWPSDTCRVDGCGRRRYKQAGADGMCRWHSENRAAGGALDGAEDGDKDNGHATPQPSDDDGGAVDAPATGGAVQPTPRRSNVHAEGTEDAESGGGWAGRHRR